MMILVTGATGFVGSAIVRARPRGEGVRAVARSASRGRLENLESLPADLSTPEGIAAALEDVSSIIHCVSYVGRHPADAWRVNFELSRALVGAAEQRGVQRLVYISTTGVYGSGEMRGADETTPIAPSSEVSRSRRAAEEVFLAAGGTVVRPHLLYGEGDRWVIPLLAKVATTAGLPNEGGASVSLLDVDSLAKQIWTLWAAGTEMRQKAFNSDNGKPIRLAQAVGQLFDRLPGLRTRQSDDGPSLTPHQQAMLARDNWFTSSLPRNVAGTVPAFRLSERMIDWYGGIAQM